MEVLSGEKVEGGEEAESLIFSVSAVISGAGVTGATIK
jgi:hypothetical protein